MNDLIIPSNMGELFQPDLLERKDAHLQALGDLPHEIIDSDTCAQWRKASVTGAKLIKEFEGARKMVTQKLDRVKKLIMEKEKEVVADLLSADLALTGALLSYSAKVDADNAKRAAIIATETAKAGRSTPDLAALQAVVPEPDHGAVAYRDIKRAAIEDPTKVPQEYWTIDMKKVQAVIDAGLTVPGIRVDIERSIIRK
jgi:hypothetical protein